jgi:putative acetyltransferase
MTGYLQVKTAEEYIAAAQLFAEYAAWLNIDLSFQHFEEELQQLKIMYGAPAGGIILCRVNNNFAGCVAIRKITADIAELKRMYVQPAQQHKGIGKKLLAEAVLLAKNCNYSCIRLDTLSNMTPAINLYKSHGFYEIPAYYKNPVATAVYFEKLL